MEKVLHAYRAGTNDTGFADYFTKADLRASYYCPESDEHSHDGARLTLGYGSICSSSALFSRRFIKKMNYSVGGRRGAVESKPDLVEINNGIEEEYWERHKAKSVLFTEHPMVKNAKFNFGLNLYRYESL